MIIICGETTAARRCWRSACCVVATGDLFPSCAADAGLVKRSGVAEFHREYRWLILPPFPASFTRTTAALCMAAAPPAVTVLQCTPVLRCPPRVRHRVALKGSRVLQNSPPEIWDAKRAAEAAPLES